MPARIKFKGLPERSAPLGHRAAARRSGRQKCWRLRPPGVPQSRTSCQPSEWEGCRALSAPPHCNAEAMAALAERDGLIPLERTPPRWVLRGKGKGKSRGRSADTMAKPSDAGRSRKQKNARVSRQGGPEASGPRARSGSSPSRVSRGAKKARRSGPALKCRGRAKDDARALAEAVFAEQDPVEVACGLLNGEGAKGDSVKARVGRSCSSIASGGLRQCRRQAPKAAHLASSLICRAPSASGTTPRSAKSSPSATQTKTNDSRPSNP